jgi:hypothetical protein
VGFGPIYPHPANSTPLFAFILNFFVFVYISKDKLSKKILQRIMTPENPK